VKFRFTAEFDDGEKIEITAHPRDQLAWEKENPGRAVSSLIQDNVRLVDTYSLAWTAAKRQGLFAGDLAKFEELVDLVGGHTVSAAKASEAVAEVEEVEETTEDPTQSAPSTDS
jgi:hypothetical protein